jgi:hypothetical protein
MLFTIPKVGDAVALEEVELKVPDELDFELEDEELLVEVFVLDEVL